MMRYATLMKKVEEGYAEVEAWEAGTTGKASAYAIVRVFGRNGTVSTKTVEVTGIPVEGQAGE